MRLIPLAIAGLVIFAPPLAAQDNRETPKPEATGPKLTPAQMRADALDRLFALLHTASDKDAPKIEENIWKLWMASDSPSADVVLNQVARAMSAKDYVAAMDMANTLVDLYPNYAEAWNKRATLFYIIGRDKESLADIEKVLALEPRHFGALSGRGMIYERQGKLGEALKAYKSALAVHPHMKSVAEAVKRLEGEAQ
jgi:tetratricopeptide (TPR) repeat protein